MHKLILIAALALSLTGCWLGDLIGTGGDSGRSKTDIGTAVHCPEPGKPCVELQ